METVKDKVERHKATAEIFLNNNIKAFIKDSGDNLYFCEILFVGEDSVRVECFGPKQRAGQKETLYWPLIVEFDEYKEGGGQ